MGNCVTTTNGIRGRNGSFSRFLREENLHLVPGRFFSNRISSSSSSSSSSIYSQQGLKGINQDAMILWEDFGGEGGVLCGVFDGHGPHGHLVARKVRDVLPTRLLSFLPDALEAESVGASNGCCAVNIKEPSSVNMRQALLRSYKAMDRHLRSHPTLDCFCSGTTAVVLLKIGSDLFLGNIGDSRAVLGSKDAGDDSMVAVQLTVDLKPDLPREAERIQRCRGRVFALQDEPEVQRVWLPFDDAPGLAMARAFGDFCLKDYGVISVPEFSHWTLTDMDRFVVLASDGVWDVLSNKEVVDIVSSSPTRSSAAQFLVDTATHEWKLKYPTSRMDDCSAVCLFLDEEMSPGIVSAENNCTAAYRNDGCFSNGSPNEESNPEPLLDRNSTVRGSRSTCMDGERGADHVAEEQNTIRVDSLVKLPRFSDDGVAD